MKQLRHLICGLCLICCISGNIPGSASALFAPQQADAQTTAVADGWRGRQYYRDGQFLTGLHKISGCRYYFDKTGRRITFEYSLVGGVNDTDEDAENLCRLVGDMNCHINLIPVNPIKERDYIESERRDILKFQNKLEKRHINVTIRREMGRDIDGACGQLRRRHAQSITDES